jgi:hypothetical protein
MISSKKIKQLASELENKNLSEQEILQLTLLDQNLQKGALQVDTVSDLPDIEANKGRMVYVKDEQEYYFSNGDDWTTYI